MGVGFRCSAVPALPLPPAHGAGPRLAAPVSPARRGAGAVGWADGRLRWGLACVWRSDDPCQSKKERAGWWGCPCRAALNSSPLFPKFDPSRKEETDAFVQQLRLPPALAGDPRPVHPPQFPFLSPWRRSHARRRTSLLALCSVSSRHSWPGTVRESMPVCLVAGRVECAHGAPGELLLP